MARPIKDGIDYFPLDVNTETDKKFRLVEARYGIVGFGIIVKLFQQIYRDSGYFCKWDGDTAAICAALWSSPRCPLTEEDVNAVVKEAVRRDIFDGDLYARHGVLTSRGLQKRYFEAVKRRLRVNAEKAYLLLSGPELPENVCVNGVNACKNPENAGGGTQSKEKESKEDKKERDALPRARPPTPEEIREFVLKERLGISAGKFFYYYEARGWRGITDWRAKAREWSLTEKKEEGAAIAAYDLDIFEKMLNEKD